MKDEKSSFNFCLFLKMKLYPETPIPNIHRPPYLAVQWESFSFSCAKCSHALIVQHRKVPHVLPAQKPQHWAAGGGLCVEPHSKAHFQSCSLWPNPFPSHCSWKWPLPIAGLMYGPNHFVAAAVILDHHVSWVDITADEVEIWDFSLVCCTPLLIADCLRISSAGLLHHLFALLLKSNFLVYKMYQSGWAN